MQVVLEVEDLMVALVEQELRVRVLLVETRITDLDVALDMVMVEVVQPLPVQVQPLILVQLGVQVLQPVSVVFRHRMPVVEEEEMQR